MSLDVLDAAFVSRFTAHPRRADRAPAAEPPRPAPPDEFAGPNAPSPEARAASRPVVVAAPADQPVPGVEMPLIAVRPAVAEPADTDPLVTRLLDAAPGQWDALADHVVAARQRGRRVIAIAGGRAGEGKTTLVRCLAATLRSRGRDVACASPHELAAVASGPDGRGTTHDKRIILVDAGVWFPPGPIRRPLLQVASLGCEAVILVRRTGAAGGAARQAALEALGIEVLGEVLTFAPPADHTHDGGQSA